MKKEEKMKNLKTRRRNNMKEKIRKKGIKILVLFIILNFLISLLPIQKVWAQNPWYNPGGGGGIFTPIFKNLLIDPIYRAVFLFKLRGWITLHGSSFARNFDKAITFNPSPENNPLISNLMKSIITFIQPFYLLSIISIGFYLLFFSGSPKGRAKAKSALPRILVSMLFFSFSPLILTLLLKASESLTIAALNITGKEPIEEILLGGIYGAHVVISWMTMASYAYGANPWSYSLFFMAWFPYIFIAARDITLTLLEIFFPMTILLYSFNYTKGIGRTLLEQTIVWTIIQFFWMLVLVALALSVPLKDELVKNPVLGGIQIPIISAIPFIGPMIGQAIGKLTFSTDIFSLTLGIVGYAMIAALPFTLIALIRGVLP